MIKRDAQNLFSDYLVLDEISRDPNTSQRILSSSTGIALGKTNQVIKRLIKKGLIKTRRINAKLVAYYLTPKGFSEKLRLVVMYAQRTISLFSCAREVTKMRLLELKQNDSIRTVALFGTGELAEAVYLTIKELDLDLTKVYASSNHHYRWLDLGVSDPYNTSPEKVDVVINTEMEMEPFVGIDLHSFGHSVIDLRELLSEKLALFARRIAEEEKEEASSRGDRS